MNPQAEALKARAHDFFIRVIKLCGDITPSAAADSIVKQLLDSAGSTDSNYAAACKGRTRKEFIAKVGLAAEEADESLRWLRSLRDAGIAKGGEVEALIKEANELTSIFVSSHKTANARLAAEQAQRRSRRESSRRTR